MTNVYATALAFMVPRTLEPVPVSQLTLWGLHGLTALDPNLITDIKDGKLRLMTHGTGHRAAAARRHRHRWLGRDGE